MRSLFLYGILPALAVAQQGEPSVLRRRCGRVPVSLLSAVSSAPVTLSTFLSSSASSHTTFPTTSIEASSSPSSFSLDSSTDISTSRASSVSVQPSLDLELSSSHSSTTPALSYGPSSTSTSQVATTFTASYDSEFGLEAFVLSTSEPVSFATSGTVFIASESISSTALSFTAAGSGSPATPTPTSNLAFSDLISTSSLSTSLTSVVTPIGSTSSTATYTDSSAAASTVLGTSSTSTSTGSYSAVTVTPGGNIASAIAFAQSNGVPTVTIKAGTYSEAVTVSATAAVTIIGETASLKARDNTAVSDYTQNLVTIANDAAVPLTLSSTAIKGVTFRNINFSNTNSLSALGAVSLKGSQLAFYGCQFVAAGQVCIQGGISSGLIADSYIEAADKIIYQYPSLYIYSSTITATAKSANILYTQGANYGTTLYNSTVVLDSCNVAQKSGLTNTFVYLFTANNNGSVALYRNTTIGSFVAASGAHVDSKTQSPLNTYLEYLTTGAGSYSQNVAARSPYVSLATSGSQLGPYEIPAFFANANPTVATTQTSWMDQGVLGRILAGVSEQDSRGSSQSSSSSSSSTSSTFSSNTASNVATSSTASASSFGTVSSTISSTVSSGFSSSSASQITVSSSSSSASESSTPTSSDFISSVTTSSVTTSSASTGGCVLPTSVPSTAKVVGPVGSCATFNNISAAVAALPSDNTAQYVYILGGTYTEQITISRVGATVFRGETDDTLSYGSNTVTIQSSSGVASNSGLSASTSPFQATQYYTSKMSFYNINFANTYTPQTNYIAAAFVGKALKTGFYGCSFKSSQGTLLLNYGAFYFANSYIEGTTDFIWGQGGAYFYNSKIVTSGVTSGQNIAAQSYQASYGPSIQVFDTCAIIPASSSVAKGSTYLGRDYSTSSRVYYINSYLDAHIASAGWRVAGSSVNVTFIEANNTGPGAATSSRISNAQIQSDTTSYTVASLLGDSSWLDTSAIAPFAGFPDSIYSATVVSSSSSLSSSVSSSTSVSPTSSTASLSATATTVSDTASSTTATLTYTVAPTPTGSQFGSVMSAVAAIPADGKAHEVYILAGTYTEQIWVNRTGVGKVTLRGETQNPSDYTGNLVTLQFNYGVSTSGTVSNENTPVLNWKRTDGSGLALYNIDFVNAYPQTPSTAALAADFYGSNMAAYGCSFKGYQDTLLANQGVQVFSNCYIEGSVDFIWGYSKAYFHQCYIASNTAGAYITAQNRPNSAWAGGYIFDSCYVTYTSSYTAGKTSVAATTYLGRPWSQYAVVVYMNSYLDKHISPAGWSVWQTSNPQTANVMFGEYNNSGPGAWGTSRAEFATNLTDSQATLYTLDAFIGNTAFIDWTAYNYSPSFSLGSTPTTTASATSSAVTASATASATWAHPTSGTIPPIGAVLVSVGGTQAGSFSNLTDALASLPDDSSTQIIFVYPGTYSEQVPTVDRAGPVMIIGYTTGNPGQAYADNTVTITHARGLSVSPVPTGHSDAETATFATAGTKISLYNINIENSDNLDGSLSSYVTLAGSIYGQHIGFYACSFLGWQDTLLTGNKAGYQYYESSYIDGAIDFIWGYSKAYFKGCTIGAKRAGSAVTAHSRASLTAVGGYIFDQCLFTAAKTATVDLTASVYLGRPYSAYALVVVKNSYLDDIIAPSGWKVWSTSNPQTDYITFAEYNNTGPGNWENNAAARVAWQKCTLLTSDTYSLASVMDSTDWIDMTYWDSIATPSPAVKTTDPVTVGTTDYDGTTPPAGAYIVSKTAIEGVTTYDTIQGALDVLPTSSKITPTVFIYPGVYSEQLVLNKSGTTIFIGYSQSPKDYSQNKVTISFNKGINTQSDASNSDSATVYATGNYFQAVNINFANTFGTTDDYASLGFAVKSSKFAGLYGCQVYGNQDALLVNGNLFASNSYIEGNIDMIWGSGAGYFLNSTIAPNEDKIALTASKRTTNTTAAGFVFDQCRVTPAQGATFSQVSLGRPWNAFARVAWIGSYLDSCIESTGWDVWTKSDPRTDGVTFGEYGNYGPGASTSGRATFAIELSDAQAAEFEVANLFTTTSWINETFVYTSPFTAANLTVPSSSATSSTISKTLSTSSTPLSTSTITTTIPSTIKTTILTTTTGSTVLVTATNTFTLDVGATVTPAPTTKTVTVKATSTNTNTVTEANEVVTVKMTTIIDVGTTVTPATSTKTVQTTATEVHSQLVTVTGKPTTVKSSTTVTSIATSTPKASTTTLSQGQVVTVTSTVTPGAAKVTSTTTVTINPGDTKTTTLKATTSTLVITTTSTKTAKATTTLTCIPAAQKAKRGVAFGTTDAALVFPRATAAGAPVTTVTVISFFTSAATKTATVPGVTSTIIVDTTKTTGKTSTLKPETVAETTTAFAVKSATVTLPGSTSTVTVVSTKETGKTTTLAASVTTVATTVFVTRTTSLTTTLPGSTITDVETATKKSTITLEASTITVTQSRDTTVKTTVTLATPTSTVLKTTTLSLTPSVTVTVQNTSTKTKTSTVVTTITTTTTKTKNGAPACTAA